MDPALPRTAEDLRRNGGGAQPHLWTWTLLILTACPGCRSFSQDDGLFAAASPFRFGALSVPWERPSDAKALAEGRRFTAESRREAEQARKLFEDGKYRQAGKLYRRIAKQYKGTLDGEQAQYQVGECRFAQREFPAAQDAYDQLFADYPSTRYIEPATRRLFAIAQDWLDISDPKHRDRIITVSVEEIQHEPPSEPLPSPRDPTVRYRILPNVHDQTRPMFDTQGRALKALKSIWLNDPTGPLADDAMMMTASYYLRRGDYVEADRYLEILRDEYADSPYLKEAYLLGSHVRLMSYQGPYYDETSLDGARQLTAQTLNLYPDTSARAQLKKDLQKMYLLKAQRLWSRVPYYEAKNNERAVGITCIQVIIEFPDTEYADLARDRLARVDRSRLEGLPGVEQQLDQLLQPADHRPVKSVNATRDERSPQS